MQFHPLGEARGESHNGRGKGGKGKGGKCGKRGGYGDEEEDAAVLQQGTTSFFARLASDIHFLPASLFPRLCPFLLQQASTILNSMFGVSRYRNEQRSGVAREGNFAMIDDDLRHGDRGRLDREEEEEMRLYNQSAPRYVNSSASRITAVGPPRLSPRNCRRLILEAHVTIFLREERFFHVKSEFQVGAFIDLAHCTHAMTGTGSTLAGLGANSMSSGKESSCKGKGKGKGKGGFGGFKGFKGKGGKGGKAGKDGGASQEDGADKGQEKQKDGWWHRSV
jgi:hypothetical protein